MPNDFLYFLVLLVVLGVGVRMLHKAVSRMRDDVTQQLHEIKLELEKRR